MVLLAVNLQTTSPPVQLGIFCFLRMILIHGLYVCYKIALFLLCDQITLHQELFIGIHHGFHTDPIISGKLSSGRQLCSRQETASENVPPSDIHKDIHREDTPFFSLIHNAAFLSGILFFIKTGY